MSRTIRTKIERRSDWYGARRDFRIRLERRGHDITKTVQGALESLLIKHFPEALLRSCWAMETLPIGNTWARTMFAHAKSPPLIRNTPARQRKHVKLALRKYAHYQNSRETDTLAVTVNTLEEACVRLPTLLQDIASYGLFGTFAHKCFSLHAVCHGLHHVFSGGFPDEDTWKARHRISQPDPTETRMLERIGREWYDWLQKTPHRPQWFRRLVSALGTICEMLRPLAARITQEYKLRNLWSEQKALVPESTPREIGDKKPNCRNGKAFRIGSLSPRKTRCQFTGGAIYRTGGATRNFARELAAARKKIHQRGRHAFHLGNVPEDTSKSIVMMCREVMSAAHMSEGERKRIIRQTMFMKTKDARNRGNRFPPKNKPVAGVLAGQAGSKSSTGELQGKRSLEPITIDHTGFPMGGVATPEQIRAAVNDIYFNLVRKLLRISAEEVAGPGPQPFRIGGRLLERQEARARTFDDLMEHVCAPRDGSISAEDLTTHEKKVADVALPTAEDKRRFQIMTGDDAAFVSVDEPIQTHTDALRWAYAQYRYMCVGQRLVLPSNRKPAWYIRPRKGRGGIRRNVDAVAKRATSPRHLRLVQGQGMLRLAARAGKDVPPEENLRIRTVNKPEPTPKDHSIPHRAGIDRSGCGPARLVKGRWLKKKR